MTATELDFVEADVGENGDDKEEDDEENEHAGRDVLAKGLCQALGEEFGVRCIGHASATGIIIREGEGNASSSIRQAVGNKDVNGGKSSDESGTDTGYAEVSVSHGDKNWDRGPSAADGLKQSRFPSRPLSMRNELAALTMLKTQLLEAADIFPTTLEHDQVRRRQGRSWLVFKMAIRDSNVSLFVQLTTCRIIWSFWFRLSKIDFPLRSSRLYFVVQPLVVWRRRDDPRPLCEEKRSTR